MVDEDLERLRRSLAMAPRLPPDEIQRLIDEVQHLRRQRRDLVADLDQVTKLLGEARRRAG